MISSYNDGPGDMFLDLLLKMVIFHGYVKLPEGII